MTTPSTIFRSEVDTMVRDFTRVITMPKSQARKILKKYTLTLLSSEVERLRGKMIEKPYPNASNMYSREVSEEDKIYNSALQSQIDFLEKEIEIIKKI